MPAYKGGKHRFRKVIGSIINAEIERRNASAYYEPFVGSAAVLEQVTTDVPRIASDINGDMIALWQNLQRGWKPPLDVTRDEYEFSKAHKEWLLPQYRAFVGIFCSYAGTLWGGYKSGDGRNYVQEAVNGFNKRLPLVQSAIFLARPFDKVSVVANSVVYCDPPYADTSGYGYPFNRDEFFEWIQTVSQHSTVYVSEYNIPDTYGGSVVWEKPTKSMTARTSNPARIERLYKFGG